MGALVVSGVNLGLRNRLESLLDPTPPALGKVAFPSFPAPPHVNGNGKLEAKSYSLTFPTGDFFPIDDRGNTLDRDFLEVLRGGGSYITSVLCHAAMRYRATKVAEAPLMVVQDSDEGEDWLKDHELAELLQYPNEDEEMADIGEQISIALDSTGHALLVKDFDRRDFPGRLTFFDGNEFTVAPANGRLYGEFRVTALNGYRADLPPLGPDRVVFFRLPRPGDRWSGLGPLQVVARQLNIEAQLLTSMISAIPNAIVPGLTIILPDGGTTEQARDVSDYLRSAYSSARRRGLPLTLGDVKDVKQNSLSYEGLAGGELYREIESAMCVAFQVRPEVLGMMVGLENAPWSHMQTAQQLAYDEGVIPIWRRIERTMTRQLLRPVDQTPDRRVAFDKSQIRALQPDLMEAAKRQDLLKGIATKNQRRVIAGLDPEEGPEWDEVEAPPPAPGQEETPREEDPEAEAKLLESKSVPNSDLLWATFDLQTKATAKSWQPEIEKLLSAMSVDVRRIFRKYAEAMGATPDEALLASFLEEVGGYIDRVGAAKARATLGPMVWATVQAEGRKTSARFRIGFDVVQKGLERYAAEETAFLVKSMGETTGQQVAKAVQDSIEARDPLTALRERLEELPAFSRERAQLVARTETTRTTNAAQRRTLSEYQAETGKSVVKAWISSRDGRVREEHAALDDGEWIPVDQPFANGLQQPSEPNCRCTLGYMLQEA